MDDRRPRVLMLLLQSPEWINFAVVVRLGKAFLDAGAELTVFVMDDAVLGLVPLPGRGKDSYPLFPLVAGGGTILVCQSTAEVRGLLGDRLPDSVRFETQVHLGHLAGTTDLFLPFSA